MVDLDVLLLKEPTRHVSRTLTKRDFLRDPSPSQGVLWCRSDEDDTLGPILQGLVTETPENVGPVDRDLVPVGGGDCSTRKGKGESDTRRRDLVRGPYRLSEGMVL